MLKEETLPLELRELRRALYVSGLNRRQLAGQTGVPLSTVNTILAGSQSTPQRTNVLREFLKLPPLAVKPRKSTRGLLPVKPAVELPAPVPLPARAPAPAALVAFVDPSLEPTVPRLNAAAREELKRHLADAQHTMLAARVALAQTYGRESKRDRHITAALNEIGHLRLAVNEDDL